MKLSPDSQRLEAILRSSKLVGGGFLGSDARRLAEIIEADARVVSRVGRTIPEIVDRMRTIGTLARKGLGANVKIEPGIQASVTDVRGMLPCPWPHAGRYEKTVVTATRCDIGQSVRWSELSLHMIEAHGFFEGRGSAFRIDPAELAAVIF